MTISKINSNSINTDEQTLSFSTSGTERVIIDSSGNVGIGTSSVTAVGPNYGTLGINGSGGGGIKLEQGGTTRGVLYGNTGGLSLSGEGATNVTFYTNATERMRIDSSGRVTLPYQPKFYAFANEGGNDSVPVNTVPTSWIVLNNTGNHFNSGVFTAPIAGTYRFFYSILSGSQGYGLVQFRKNGSGALVAGVYQNWGQLYNYTTNNDKAITRELIIDLAQNDTIDLITSPAHNKLYWSGGYSYFGGQLLG